MKKVEKVQKVDEKKQRKARIRAWLFTSIFSIISATLGLVNLIVHFVDK